MINIKLAKQEIKDAITSYLLKDEYGHPIISTEKQRPIFLVGAPGIGKTAIMEQIAQECNLPLVSYSMTHHTRQSAQGMPKVVEKEFDGKMTSITEYTMSEIIASVYEVIEKTGSREGILFLDEINCVSETLSPLMLQFLQYKTFGNHKLPEGWILVTAGNPPAYNKSVREFDVATLDRLRKIDVEPQFDAWKEYAFHVEIHPAILSFLEVKKDKFYSVATVNKGKEFVTARGWEDLSNTIRAYEKLGIVVNEEVIIQFVQNREIAKSFAVYYDLFKKYRSDYQVDKILEGTVDDSIMNRAKAAKFDERIALIGLLEDATINAVRDNVITRNMLAKLATHTGASDGPNAVLNSGDVMPYRYMTEYISDLESELHSAKYGNKISKSDELIERKVIDFLKDCAVKIESVDDGKKAWEIIVKQSAKAFDSWKATANKLMPYVDNALKFIEDVFGDDSNEMVVYLAAITTNKYASEFCRTKPGERYKRLIREVSHNSDSEDIFNAIDELDSLRGDN